MIVGGSGRGERGRLLLFALAPLLEERGESALKIGRINAASIGCCSRRAWPTTNLRAAVAGLPSGSVRRAPTPRYGTRPPDEAHVVTFVVTQGFRSQYGNQKATVCRPFFSGPCWDRTSDLGIKSPVLYQLS